MSYAGLYEPCPHDRIPNQCGECNGHNDRLRREYPLRMKHPEDALTMPITLREVTLFSAKCPNKLCEWRRVDIESIEALRAEITEHVKRCQEVKTDWEQLIPENLKS